MSLLRALRAYVGLGPDEDYEEHYIVDRSRAGADMAVGAQRQPRTRSRGSYLDDYYSEQFPSGGEHRESDDDVIDIRNARIDAERADGSEATTERGPNHSRNRIGDRKTDRQQSLDENGELLDQIEVAILADDHQIAYPDSPTQDLHSATSRPAAEYVESELDDDGGDHHAQSDVGLDPEASQGAVVRSIDSARSRPRTLNPESFSDAKHVADEFKRGAPVVVNLQGLDRDLVRRLVDFASGICYALDGSMEKLAPQVFLLTPDGLHVTDSDRRRIEERGYAR